MIGNDEIRYFTEADEAAIHKVPGFWDREQGVSIGDVNSSDARASCINAMRTVGVSDNRPGKDDVIDRVLAVSMRLGKRHCSAAM